MTTVRYQAIWRRNSAPKRGRGGRGVSLSASQGTLRPARQQPRSVLIEVCQAEGGVRARQVLCQPAVPRPVEAPLAFHDQKRVLTARAHARPAPVDLAPAVRNRLTPVAPPVHAVTDPLALERLAIGFIPIRAVAKQLLLVAVK